MIEILLSSIISCSEAQKIAFNVQKSKSISASVKKELLLEIKKASPKKCTLP